jgi:hypothetical protein
MLNMAKKKTPRKKMPNPNGTQHKDDVLASRTDLSG